MKAMLLPSASPVVHLELHTPDGPGALDLYSALCRWQPERIETAHGSYHAIEVGRGLGGGIVECPTRHALWLPYVEVTDVGAATAHAERLGARPLLTAREGPGGWGRGVGSPAR